MIYIDNVNKIFTKKNKEKKERKEKMKKELSFKECVERVCGNNIILCNNVSSDETFMENVYEYYSCIHEDEIQEIIDNINDINDINNVIDDYSLSINVNEYDSVDELRNVIENHLQYDWDIPVFQYYLTSCSEWDVKYNEKYLNNVLDLVYCETLDLYVLCVTHYGTSWEYVAGTTIDVDF